MLHLGIDPGLARIGFALIEKTSDTIRVVDFGVITTAPGPTLESRLTQLRQDLESILSSREITSAGVEKLFFETNVKTAMDVAQARGVIIEYIHSHGIPIIHLTPLEVKAELTGDGSADKRQVMDMLKLIFGTTFTAKFDDAADALAIAYIAAMREGKNIET